MVLFYSNYAQTEPKKEIEALPTSRSKKRVVVIGNGVVGFRFCEKLLAYAHQGEVEITVFGKEKVPAYDRISLTGILKGTDPNSLTFATKEWYEENGIKLHLGDPIIAIDREARQVTSARGIKTDYDHLVLAMGAAPCSPPIEIKERKNVFFYRSMRDLHDILEQSKKAKSAAIIGAGLLGLEVADRFIDMGLDTHVLEFGDRIMGRMMGPSASGLLLKKMEDLGVKIRVSMATERIERKNGKNVLHFKKGDPLAVDLVVMAAGVRPMDSLAAEAGLACSERGGIAVDDHMRTTDPQIYAIGDCALHDGVFYGLAAPGVRMADTLAKNLTGDPVRYTGGNHSTSLNVHGFPLAFLGEPGEGDHDVTFKTDGVYRQLTFSGNQIKGAVVLGKWADLSFVSEAVDFDKKLSPFQLRRFRKKGSLLRVKQDQPVSEWPQTAQICHCLQVNKGQLCQAISEGCQTVEALSATTGAGSGCGLCKHHLADLVGQKDVAKPKGLVGLAAFSTIALALLAFLIFSNPLPEGNSVQSLQYRISQLWHDGFWKQVSGYALAGLFLGAVVFSLRKRWGRFSLGDLGVFRVIHCLIGALTLPVFIMHTGMNFGSNFNAMLSMGFMAAIMLGSITGLLMFREQSTNGKGAAVRRKAGLIHILLLWPLPVFLIFHLMSVYYY